MNETHARLTATEIHSLTSLCDITFTIMGQELVYNWPSINCHTHVLFHGSLSVGEDFMRRRVHPWTVYEETRPGSQSLSHLMPGGYIPRNCYEKMSQGSNFFFFVTSSCYTSRLVPRFTLCWRRFHEKESSPLEAIRELG